MPLSSHRRNSRTALFSSLSVFKIWSHILWIWDLSPSAPNFKETLMVAIKQGGIAEAAIGSINGYKRSVPLLIPVISLFRSRSIPKIWVYA